MKKLCVFIILAALSSTAFSQNWESTSTPTTTSDFNTKIQLTHIGWGSHHGILFNSQLKSPLSNGDLLAGNVLQSFDVGPYSSGAGAIMFLGNGGRMDFLISPTSSGAGTAVDWGTPKITIERGGNIGFNNLSPFASTNNKGLHIAHGDHTSILLGNPIVNGNGGILQTSDNRHRVFIGANYYDDSSMGWKNFQTGKGGAGISILADQGGWGTGIDFYASTSDNQISSARMHIDGNGKIGIDNAVPEAVLHIGTSNLGYLRSVRMMLEPPQHTGAAWEFSVRDDAASSFLGIGYGAEQVTFHHNGNIGIGTPTPSYKLDVAGTSRTTSLIINPTANSNSQIYFMNQGALDWDLGTQVGIATQDFNLYNRGTSSIALSVNKSSNNVGIGTTNPGSFKLAVEGKIGAREVNVTLASPWPDYVFSTNYKLPSLTELELYIKTNKHLPEVPTAEQVKENGLSLGEMNAILLKKVEELTLHIIELEKRVKQVEKQ